MKLPLLILSEIVGMFFDDEFLALAILAVVAASAALAFMAKAPPLVTGAVLLVGCVAILATSCLEAVRKNRFGGK